MCKSIYNILKIQRFLEKILHYLLVKNNNMNIYQPIRESLLLNVICFQFPE